MNIYYDILKIIIALGLDYNRFWGRMCVAGVGDVEVPVANIPMQRKLGLNSNMY